jgi:neutral ceramidase
MRQPSLAFVACVAIVLLTVSAPASVPQEPGTIRVGASKVDITPAAGDALPMSGYAGRKEGFKAIHDDLNVRAVVVDDGASQAAIVTCELIGISAALWERFTTRVTEETRIPRDNILIAAVHTHAAPSLGVYGEPVEGEEARKRAAYVQRLEDAVSTAVRQARANLQPARIGFGSGKAHVNTNRRARNAEGGWMLGNNPEGVSDKTVAVIKFETTSGAPLAILANYGVHATVLGPGNLQISSDLAGATSRAVEKHYGGGVVSPWTSAAAGDQDPIYRVGTDFRNVDALGYLLAEEVIRVADGITTSPRARIRGHQKVVTCAGKRTVQSPGPNREYKIEDADPVSIRLSLLLLSDIAVAGVSGEVLTNIGLRLKRESPLTRTMLVTHCNGSSGYLPDDAAYEQVSYEIVTSRVKPGCAENAIVSGLLDMIATTF